MGTIFGCSDEYKGFRVFIRMENKVITTQHVKNIETLSEAQNRQLQLALDEDDRADSDEGTETPLRQSSIVTASKKPKKKKLLTRHPHVTRGAAKKAAASQQEVSVSADFVNHVFERDPRNYGEAMKRKKRN